MHRQGMQAGGEFVSQQTIDEAMSGEGLESREVIANDQQLEVGLSIRGRIVLGSFVDQLQMERAKLAGNLILDALGTTHGVLILGGLAPDGNKAGL